MFDTEAFVADCRKARAQDRSGKAVREVVERAVSEPGAILRALGEPTAGGVTRLFHSDELTVLNMVWTPHMTLMPHNHEMWAVIGIYTGREDNIFWKRLPGRDDGRIEAVGAKELCEKNTTLLGPHAIHSVTNPVRRLTGALHVYGGDFFGTPRSEWDPENLLERPYDVDKVMALFEEGNARLAEVRGDR